MPVILCVSMHAKLATFARQVVPSAADNNTHTDTFCALCDICEAVGSHTVSTDNSVHKMSVCVLMVAQGQCLPGCTHLRSLKNRLHNQA